MGRGRFLLRRLRSRRMTRYGRLSRTAIRGRGIADWGGRRGLRSQERETFTLPHACRGGAGWYALRPRARRRWCWLERTSWAWLFRRWGRPFWLRTRAFTMWTWEWKGWFFIELLAASL